jgi:hypothetical protein
MHASAAQWHLLPAFAALCIHGNDSILIKLHMAATQGHTDLAAMEASWIGVILTRLNQ